MLLDQLQQVTGRNWDNVERGRRRMYDQLGNRWKTARSQKVMFYLAIKETSRVGSAILEPYFYRAALQPRGSGEGDLYLFAGENKQLVAVVHVLIKDERNDVSDGTPVYKATDSVPETTEIRTPTRTLAVAASQLYEFDPECPILP